MSQGVGAVGDDSSHPPLVHHADLVNATLTFELATTPVHAVLPH